MAISPGRDLRIATHGRGMWQIPIFAPTAANVSIAGRVSTAEGRGFSNAVVTLTDSNGNSRSTQTGSFGYYGFEEVTTGETYTVSIRSKRFQFTPRIVSVSDSISDLDFIANSSELLGKSR